MLVMFPPGKDLLVCFFCLRDCFERKHDLMQRLQVIHLTERLQLLGTKHPCQRFRPDSV